MKKEETITVYWAMHTKNNKQTLSNLLWQPPVHLRKILPNGPEKINESYRKCPAAIDFWKNTYAILHPVDGEIFLNEDTQSPIIFKAEPQYYWAPRPESLENQNRIDIDFAWLFFSEESLKIQQTPPFMHNTLDRNYGSVASGSFDISKWFRGINISYNLWPNVHLLKVKKDDPATYIQFLTDKKIELKQFELTPELNLLVEQVVQFKMISQNESLEKLYDRFVRSKRHKRVINLIKENLLD